MDADQVRELAEAQSKPVRVIGKKSDETRWVQNLKKNRGLNPQRYFVIEGIWLHGQALQNPVQLHSFIVCPDLIYSDRGQKTVEWAIERAKNVYVMLSSNSFARIADRDSPHGVVSVCRYPQWDLSGLSPERDCTFVVLDGLETPGNVGTIIRSVDGAAADGVIFCDREGSVRINHPKLIRASQCTCFSAPLIEAGPEEILPWLSDNDFFRVTARTRSRARQYHEPHYSGRVAIVAGNERYGVHAAWQDIPHRAVSIPMLGQIDSLNVGVATSMVLYEASLKQKGYLKRQTHS